MIIPLSAMVTVSAFLIYRRVSGRILLPTISSAFFVYYLVFAFIGSNLLLLRIYSPPLTTVLTADGRLLWAQYLLVCVTWLVVGGSMYLAQQILRFSPKKEVTGYFERPLSKIASPHESYLMPFLWIVTIAGLAFVGYILYQIQSLNISLPILAVFERITGVEFIHRRVLMAQALANRHYLAVGDTLLRLTLFISFVYMRRQRLFKWKILVLMLLVVCIVTALISGTKATLAELLVELIVLNFMIGYCRNGRKRRRVSVVYLKLILPALIVSVGIIAGLLIVSKGSVDVALSALAKRVFVGQVEGTYHVMDIFPDKRDFLFAHVFANPGGIFPWEPEFVSELLAKELFPTAVREKMFLSLNTDLGSAGYAMAGWAGVLFTSLVFGFLAQVVNIIFLRNISKNAITLSIYVVLVVGWVRGALGDINSAFMWGQLDLYALFLAGYLMHKGARIFRVSYVQHERERLV